MVAKANALRIHVHDDTRVLDGMSVLVELARGSRALEDTLCAMSRQVAEIAAVDVVSVYLREQRPGGDALVLRGNVGFPAEAIGRVELGLSEGLTGVVAERRRPVTVAVAQEDARYKHVDGIGEEQLAAYLGVPLLVGDDLAGVLVLQRRRPHAFGDADVALAASLTAPFVLAIARDGTRLHGVVGTPLVGGRAVGPAAVLPRVSATPTSEAAALHALEFDQVAAAQRLGHGGPAVGRALENLGLVAIALRERLSAGMTSEDVIAALERVPYRAIAGAKELRAIVDERHREVSDLWSFLVADMQHRLSLCGAVLVVPRMGTFVALEAVARGAVAVVIGEVAEPGARAVLEAAQVPAIAGVPELVAGARRGELLEVDADRGIVRAFERL